MPIVLRPECAEDILAIYAVHALAFPTEVEARLVDALRAAGHLSISIVAEDRGKLVGHVAFSPVSLDSITGGLGLAPLAVIPEYQHRGIGGLLVRNGLEAAAGAGYVVVLGHPQFYAQFGFRPASRVGLRNEYGVDEQFMALQLRPDSLPSAGGLVRYGDEFSAWSGN